MHEIGMVQNCRQPGNRRMQGFRRPSFPCVRAGGKDTPAKSQPLAIYDVKFQEYFANRVGNLAKRQSTRSPGNRFVASLHQVACNAVQRRAMHCNDLQCDATTCNASRCSAMPCNDVQCIAKGVGAMSATCNETLGSGEPGCGKSPSARSWQAGLAGSGRGPNHFRVCKNVAGTCAGKSQPIIPQGLAARRRPCQPLGQSWQERQPGPLFWSMNRARPVKGRLTAIGLY